MAIQRVTENTVREAPISGQRLQAANYDAGEIRAKALQGFGQQLGQVAEAADEIVYKFDLAEAKKADSEDAIELAKIRAEALSAVGVDAPKAAENARLAAEQLKKTRLSELKGRRGKLYAASFDERMAAFEGQVTEHSIKQADVAERGAAAGRAETSVQLAVDGHDDEQVYTSNMSTAEAEYKKANAGKAPDELNRGWYEQRSKAHVAIVQSEMALHPDDPGRAQKWMDDHSKEIAPEDEPALRKSLNPLIEDQQSDADFARSQALAAGDTNATHPDDGEDDHSAPTPAVPRAAGEKPQDVIQHLVNGKGRVTDNATAHRLRGSGNATDIAAPYGTPIRPPMSGKVIKSWFDADHGGGWSMLIQHPNGMVTGYAHMKSKGWDAGMDVDSTTVIGNVGQTGHATGPHLHFTVRKAGQKVDPQTVDWAAVAGSGGPPTVDPTKVSWKEGELPRYTADKNSINTLTDNIYRLATKEGWSRQRYDRAIAKAKDFAGVSETLYRAQYDDFKDKVNGKVAALEEAGTPLTSVTQLGGDYGQLEGSDQLAIQNMISANKKALQGDQVKPYGEDFNDWNLMARGTPNEVEAFLKHDFRVDSTMTAGERSRMSTLQADIRKDQTGKLTADQGRIMRYVNMYAGQAGFNRDAANSFNAGTNQKGKDAQRKRSILVDRTTAAVQREQQRRNQPLSDAEVDAIVRAEVVTVTYEGTEMKVYEMRAKGGGKDQKYAVHDMGGVYDTMPDVVRSRIRSELEARGVAVTPRLIVETYLEETK